jgi:hypothetical protein
MSFQRKDAVCSKICTYDKIIEEFDCFEYFINENEEDISQKILDYNREKNIINPVFKPNLVQIKGKKR